MSKYAGRDYKKIPRSSPVSTRSGETIEETVHREVMEEVGLKVKNPTYYKSQPWSFSGTLLMGFFCELDGGGRDDHSGVRTSCRRPAGICRRKCLRMRRRSLSPGK